MREAKNVSELGRCLARANHPITAIGIAAIAAIHDKVSRVILYYRPYHDFLHPKISVFKCERAGEWITSSPAAHGKLLDERGKLKPPGFLWFEQVKPAA